MGSSNQLCPPAEVCQGGCFLEHGLRLQAPLSPLHPPFPFLAPPHPSLPLVPNKPPPQNFFSAPSNSLAEPTSFSVQEPPSSPPTNPTSSFILHPASTTNQQPTTSFINIRTGSYTINTSL